MKEQDEEPKLIYKILAGLIFFGFMVAANYGGMYYAAIRNDWETEGIFPFALMGAIMGIFTIFLKDKKGK